MIDSKNAYKFQGNLPLRAEVALGENPFVAGESFSRIAMLEELDYVSGSYPKAKLIYKGHEDGDMEVAQLISIEFTNFAPSEAVLMTAWLMTGVITPVDALPFVRYLSSREPFTEPLPGSRLSHKIAASVNLSPQTISALWERSSLMHRVMSACKVTYPKGAEISLDQSSNWLAYLEVLRSQRLMPDDMSFRFILGMVSLQNWVRSTVLRRIMTAYARRGSVDRDRLASELAAPTVELLKSSGIKVKDVNFKDLAQDLLLDVSAGGANLRTMGITPENFASVRTKGRTTIGGYGQYFRLEGEDGTDYPTAFTGKLTPIRYALGSKEYRCLLMPPGACPFLADNRMVM